MRKRQQLDRKMNMDGAKNYCGQGEGPKILLLRFPLVITKQSFISWLAIKDALITWISF